MLIKNNNNISLVNFYPKELTITNINENPNKISIFLKSTEKKCTCPKCGIESLSCHSTHRRKIQDLPILGKHTELRFTVYDYNCLNELCDTKTFSESFNDFINKYSYMTNRLVDLVTNLAVETSCESAARILKSMNVKISGDTVIRLLTRCYENQAPAVCGSTIGVDDFAFKKRFKYGTIIVDGQTHEPIALLDGRDGKTLKEWLQNNKHVKTITRDRASAYASAIETILPDCMQIADRFHLHQNLLEAVKKILGRELRSSTIIETECDSKADHTSRKYNKEYYDIKKK